MIRPWVTAVLPEGDNMLRVKKKHSHLKCQWCKREGIRESAIWRAHGDFLKQLACEEHKHLIDEREDPLNEADYESWMRV